MKNKLRELSEICWAWNYVNPFFYATVVLLFLYVIIEFLVKRFWRYVGLYDYFRFKVKLKNYSPSDLFWYYKRLHDPIWESEIKPSRIAKHKRWAIKERYLRIKRAK